MAIEIMDRLKNADFLCTLLRVALFPEEGKSIEIPQKIDWEAIYQLASEQGVLAIAWDGLNHLIRTKKINSEGHPLRLQRLQWAINVQKIETRYKRQTAALEALAAFYAQHDIPLMLLKGYGLSLNYPVPHHRQCGDIDIWLYGQQQRADELLQASGVTVRKDEHHHTVFSFHGITVENHYDFLNLHSHRSNRNIEARLQHLAQNGSKRTIVNGQTIWLPSADFNALFLLRHTAAHFAATGIQLRHVIDWAMFLNKHGDQINWTALMQIATQANMHHFLGVISQFVEKYLGCKMPSHLADVKTDNSLTERVLKDIIVPTYSSAIPEDNVLVVIWFKWRRWWSNRWKHRMVYQESLVTTVFTQFWSHLLKPKSFIR